MNRVQLRADRAHVRALRTAYLASKPRPPGKWSAFYVLSTPSSWWCWCSPAERKRRPGGCAHPCRNPITGGVECAAVPF